MSLPPRTSRPTRRASIMQPLHRRPFYSKNERSFETYTTSRPISRGPGIDHGMDNFSYNPEHLKRYEMDPDLNKTLPEELVTQASLWQCAAAALETSLERVNELYKEAAVYAFPTQQTHPSRLRSVSEVLPRVVSAGTPPYIHSPIPVDTNPFTFGRASFLQLDSRPQVVSVETPPTTPPCLSFSSGSSMPEDNTFPPLERSDTEAASFTAEPAPKNTRISAFDPISWETYTLKYERHMNDVKAGLLRLLGYGRKINILCLELTQDYHQPNKEVAFEFTKWWAPMERIFIPELQSKVDNLESPDLAYIRLEHELTALSMSPTVESC